MPAPTPTQPLPPRIKIGAGRIALSLAAVLGSLAMLLFAPASPPMEPAHRQPPQFRTAHQPAVRLPA